MEADPMIDPPVEVITTEDAGQPVDHFLPGDTIQASRGRGSDTEPAEVAEGDVSAVDGDIITLGTRTYSATEGWVFELIRRALALPETLCEIDAQRYSVGGTIRLMGKVTIWTAEDGTRVPAPDISSFTVA